MLISKFTSICLTFLIVLTLLSNHVSGKKRLKDIFLSVKTTQSNHRTRLAIILKTWFKQAPEDTYFFTDQKDDEFNRLTNGHLIKTNCSASHHRTALCCKMSAEFDTFLATSKKWFCHFDDDNYVHVPSLVKHLSRYSPNKPWYLGKPSTLSPLVILNPDDQSSKISFWFATGGAGFCISRALANKMAPFASKGKFMQMGEKIRLPDDVTIGYIIEHLLSINLTVVDTFHSHLEPMNLFPSKTLKDQITFSYSRSGTEMNVVNVNSTIDSSKDPTRFMALYCHLNGC
ncbi:fringe glycosyltransferase [Tetranychus urticae]|uniref:Fringe-like glycosyltransferase domain-containing protein n=1 Tax=Tetranychus urticae TaxID=32264 RepID=T1K3K2_TETUR|nr:fringe glycosyltransferase [Tetranychus urticae]